MLRTIMRHPIMDCTVGTALLKGSVTFKNATDGKTYTGNAARSDCCEDLVNPRRTRPGMIGLTLPMAHISKLARRNAKMPPYETMESRSSINMRPERIASLESFERTTSIVFPMARKKRTLSRTVPDR